MSGFIDFIARLFSPTRRLRAAHAKQLDAMAQKLNEVIRERDAARMLEKINSQKQLAACEELRGELESVHGRLAATNAKLVAAEKIGERATEIARNMTAERDRLAADLAKMRGAVAAAEGVRDRAVTDMNHVQELQREAERKLADMTDRAGKFADTLAVVLNEIDQLRNLVTKWADQVKRTAGGRVVEAVTLPVVDREATLTMGRAG